MLAHRIVNNRHIFFPRILSMENPVKDHEIETGAEADFIGSELTHFSDFDVVLELIRSFCSVDWQSAWKAKWEWLVMVISKYQEQPTLLSPYLEALVSPMYNRLLGLMESFGAFEQSSLINFQVIKMIGNMESIGNVLTWYFLYAGGYIR